MGHITSATSPRITGWPVRWPSWERLKIGGGTPPILTRHGWLVIYHGVSELAEPSREAHKFCYSAGVMVLSQTHPRLDLLSFAGARADGRLAARAQGTVANVVFPTGIDQRLDLGSPDRFDVYYGMADNRIGVARLDVPEFLSPGARRPVTCRGLASNQRRVADRRSSGDSDGGQRRIIANMTHLAANAARIVGGHEEKAAGSKEAGDGDRKRSTPSSRRTAVGTIPDPKEHNP